MSFWWIVFVIFVWDFGQGLLNFDPHAKGWLPEELLVGLVLAILGTLLKAWAFIELVEVVRG